MCRADMIRKELYTRLLGRRIYLHGHLSSRLLKVLSDDGEVKACLAFTNVDGVVVAMSPFHSR